MADKNHEEGTFVYQPPEELNPQRVCELVVEWLKQYVQRGQHDTTLKITSARADRDPEIVMLDAEVWRVWVAGFANDSLPFKAELRLMQTDYMRTFPRQPVPKIALLSFEGL